MSDDDDEVILKSSQLHKYLLNTNETELHTDDVFVGDERVSPSFEVEGGDKSARKDTDNVCFKKIKVSGGTSDIINVIIRTGLLYPDHIIDLEELLEIGNSKSDYKISKIIPLLYSSLLFTSASIVLLLRGKTKMLHCGGIAVSAFCSYKICSSIKAYRNFQRITYFTSGIEQLFISTKKALAFILESEFLLRCKVVKDQPFYVPKSGWVNAVDGLKYSGLLLPKLRKTLLITLLDIIVTFHNLIKCMERVLPMKPAFENNCYFINIEEVCALQEKNDMNPSSGDLKMLNNIYLVTQSECLKRLILSFIEELWSKKKYENMNIVISEIINSVDKFKEHTSNLDKTMFLLYKQCTLEMRNDTTQMRMNGMLKSKNANDKLYIFVRNFLAKADAHIFSLLLDLRMVNDWMNEFEENNRENGEDCHNKLLTTLQERLQMIRSNIDFFINLYNDNCNTLKNMTSNKTDTNIANENSVNACEKLSERVKRTGVEVGKSNFNPTGKDEVLISLSNLNCMNEISDDIDYEEEILRKCLPENVLTELKYALRGKKEEWIERERNAIAGTDTSIDNLDFDNLVNSNDSEFKVLTSKNSVQYRHKCKSVNCDLCNGNENLPNNSEDNSCFIKELITELNPKKGNDSKDIPGSFQPSSIQNCNYESIDSVNISNTNNDSSENVLTRSQNVFNSKPINEDSFTNQIKFAQKLFNLNATEEEFFDDCSEEEDVNSEDL